MKSKNQPKIEACQCCGSKKSMFRWVDQSLGFFDSRRLVCFECAPEAEDIEKMLLKSQYEKEKASEIKLLAKKQKSA